MTSELRETVRLLYQFRCGYCGVTEVDTGNGLEIDHYLPVSRGGKDQLENLVYCCSACNRFKGSVWAPANSARRILHPLRDDTAAHFREGLDGQIIALTETGQFHIETLHLNRPQLVAQRKQRLLINQLEQSLVVRQENQSTLEQLLASRQNQLLEILRALFRMPNE